MPNTSPKRLPKFPVLNRASMVGRGHARVSDAAMGYGARKRPISVWRGVRRHGHAGSVARRCETQQAHIRLSARRHCPLGLGDGAGVYAGAAPKRLEIAIRPPETFAHGKQMQTCLQFLKTGDGRNQLKIFCVFAILSLTPPIETFIPVV